MTRSAWRRALLAVAAVSIALAGPAPARAQTVTPATSTPEEKAAAIVRPAMVYLEQEWKAWVKIPRSSDLYFQGYVNDGQPFTWGTRCSGFIVNPNGYIVTAGHCVDTSEEGARGTALEFAVGWLADNGWIYRRDASYWLQEGHMSWKVEGEEANSPPDLQVFVQRGVAAGGLRTGEAYPARVVDFQPWSEGDVAVLKIEESDLPVVLLAASATIDIGTPVLSVGYPGSTDYVTDQSYEPTFKDGQINAEKTRENGLLPVYEMSAALSGGMSGGPTVNMNGEVVGVNSFNIRGETEAFNFITPSSLVSEMLARNGATNELGPIDEAYRAGVDAFFAGDYRTAISKFDEVLGLSPTHQQAQEYKVEATKLAASQPSSAPGEQANGKGDGSGFPAWAIALIAVLAVSVIGLGFVFVRRGRKPKMPVVPMEPAPVSTAVAAPIPPRVPAEPAKVGFRPPTGPAGVAPQPPRADAAAPAGEGPGARFCSSCGNALETGVRFCASCGTPVG